MDAFKESKKSIRYPENIHPHRRDPKQVLKRFKKAIRKKNFRASDEAWILVDIDYWDKSDIEELLKWAESDPRHHVAISNPKFELFLIMHYERGNGCTTTQLVNSTLKTYIRHYDKRLSKTQFRRKQILEAVANAEMKRAGCKDTIPAPGMTDVYLLIKRLMGGEV